MSTHEQIAPLLDAYPAALKNVKLPIYANISHYYGGDETPTPQVAINSATGCEASSSVGATATTATVTTAAAAAGSAVDGTGAWTEVRSGGGGGTNLSSASQLQAPIKVVFGECSSSASSVPTVVWELVPSAVEGAVLIKINNTGTAATAAATILAPTQSAAAAAPSGCVTAAGSAELFLSACNSTNPAQQWKWNVSAPPNERPAGAGGFVQLLATSAASVCPDSATHGCCLTENGGGAAAIWGCCPSGPSDCGNQRFTLGYTKSTLH